MKTIVIVGHPDLSTSIVNRKWVEALRPYEGEGLKVHRLDKALKEDGTFDLEKEQALLEQYDRIVLQFPLYWYMPPAIMKLWMDTVWAEGWAWGDCPHALKGIIIEAATSCGAPEVAFSGTSLASYLSFVGGSAGFVQAVGGDYFAFYGAGSPGYEERLAENCKEYIKFICNK
ncbi:NAD(P)H-dependent oxidoreductase [Porphyromonas levii]|uniref:NAD(P)H-dependent oxidoreductase n=1 Tax=Porphyromonas levii TaxID=28114 RepID=UPI00037A1CBF|nr:NAD(P)H-dependent oxidoreductase [Porphyromonas levii]MBR8712780.1 General stress protein 14 [Porphyromonas levii]MBR8714829.1 General stress protein 14 [Porphyromonas levii]MBR8727311.1 General stress protein 14 [Porphyromonas levii]MBR8729649.1 General stress protein 14 [Porphyromonas levii]MBR8732110.1 General stress protein 14 [Porphyromonas levii]